MSLPLGTQITHCRDCGSPIVWAVTTANQRRMPVDITPIVGGNIVITSGPEARVLTKQETADRQARGDKLFVSHFTTCPNAEARRKR